MKTSIRVLPRHPLSDRDDFYLFEYGRPTCRYFVFCRFVSKTSIRVKTSISVKRRSVFCRVTLCPIETIFTFLKLADQTTDFLFSVNRVKNVVPCQKRRFVFDSFVDPCQKRRSVFFVLLLNLQHISNDYFAHKNLRLREFLILEPPVDVSLV